jgi:hypothetical protein
VTFSFILSNMKVTFISLLVLDQLFLYVICHPKPEDRIEVFEVLTSLTLNYVRTITDPNFDLYVHPHSLFKLLFISHKNISSTTIYYICSNWRSICTIHFCMYSFILEQYICHYKYGIFGKIGYEIIHYCYITSLSCQLCYKLLL